MGAPLNNKNASKGGGKIGKRDKGKIPATKGNLTRYYKTKKSAVKFVSGRGPKGNKKAKPAKSHFSKSMSWLKDK